MAYCENCGAELPEGALYCEECGRPVEAGVPEVSSGQWAGPVGWEDAPTEFVTAGETLKPDSSRVPAPLLRHEPSREPEYPQQPEVSRQPAAPQQPARSQQPEPPQRKGVAALPTAAKAAIGVAIVAIVVALVAGFVVPAMTGPGEGEATPVQPDSAKPGEDSGADDGSTEDQDVEDDEADGDSGTTEDGGSSVSPDGGTQDGSEGVVGTDPETVLKPKDGSNSVIKLPKDSDTTPTDKPTDGTTPSKPGDDTTPAKPADEPVAEPAAADYDTSERPIISEFIWYTSNMDAAVPPEGATALATFAAVQGGWKAYIYQDPVSEQGHATDELLSARIGGSEASATLTLDWYWTRDVSTGTSRENTSPDSEYSGAWTPNGLEVLGMGGVKITDFWLRDGHEYAVGTISWPDATHGRIALVRP